jgi:hypothetical protein
VCAHTGLALLADEAARLANDMSNQARLPFGRALQTIRLAKLSLISEARSGTLTIWPVSKARRRPAPQDR